MDRDLQRERARVAGPLGLRSWFPDGRAAPGQRRRFSVEAKRRIVEEAWPIQFLGIGCGAPIRHRRKPAVPLAPCARSWANEGGSDLRAGRDRGGLGKSGRQSRQFFPSVVQRSLLTPIFLSNHRANSSSPRSWLQRPISAMPRGSPWAFFTKGRATWRIPKSCQGLLRCGYPVEACPSGAAPGAAGTTMASQSARAASSSLRAGQCPARRRGKPEARIFTP